MSHDLPRLKRAQWNARPEKPSQEQTDCLKPRRPGKPSSRRWWISPAPVVSATGLAASSPPGAVSTRARRGLLAAGNTNERPGVCSSGKRRGGPRSLTSDQRPPGPALEQIERPPDGRGPTDSPRAGGSPNVNKPALGSACIAGRTAAVGDRSCSKAEI